MTEAHVDPTREQFDAFKALPRDALITMLNLGRYRERAAYPDGHDCAALGLTPPPNLDEPATQRHTRAVHHP